MQKIVEDFFQSVANVKVDIEYSEGIIDANFFNPKLTAEQVKEAQRLSETSKGICSFAEFVENSGVYFDEKWVNSQGKINRNAVEDALEIQQDYDLVGMGYEYDYLLEEIGEDSMGEGQEYRRECGLMAKMTKSSQENILDLFEDFVAENKYQYFED